MISSNKKTGYVAPPPSILDPSPQPAMRDEPSAEVSADDDVSGGSIFNLIDELVDAEEVENETEEGEQRANIK